MPIQLTDTPISASAGFIYYFTADQTVIPAGGCVTLNWKVVGAREVTQFGSNWPLDSQPMVVQGTDQAKTCPSAAARYVPNKPVIYTLSAAFLDGSC